MANAKVMPSPNGKNADKYATKEETETPGEEGGEEEGKRKDEEEQAKIDRTAQAKAFWNPQRKVINPFSDWMSRWDQTIMLVLVWTALVTPFEVSFLEPDLNYLFVLNRLIDFVFITDMVFTFLLDPVHDESLKVNGLPSHRRIASKYLQGWFTVDLISTMPFDAITIAMRGGSDDVQKLKFLRAMRLLRLVKLLRLLRVSRIFERWEDRIAINFAMLSLIKSSVGTLLCSHWIGCLWYITAYIENADANWIKSTTVDSYGSLEDPGVSTYDKYIASWCTPYCP